MDTKELIDKYYGCWLNSDRNGARSLVTDDLKFRSPQDNFESADDFFNKCWKFSEGFNAMDILHAVYDSDGAYIVYGGEGFWCGELIKTEDGKIKEIYVTFDPTK